MRKLDAAPRDLVQGGTPSFGSFRGGLPKLDFGRVPKSALWQWTHKKRWIYAALGDERVFVATAIVSLGYASTAIVFVLDRERGEMLVDRSLLVPDASVRFSDDGSGRRSARFTFGPTRVDVGDTRIAIDMPRDGHSPPVHVLATMDGDGPEPISAVVPVEGGYANATEKRVVDARGEVVAGGRRFVLDRALAGLDHTMGYVARHTVWRWAFGLGRVPTGERLAFNLTEGFVGEAECGVWLGDTLFPTGEGRFSFDEGNPEKPWGVATACGSVDLTFVPKAIHAEHKNLVVVRSKFIQPVGAFNGRIRLGEREIDVRDLGGVTEHQDVLW